MAYEKKVIMIIIFILLICVTNISSAMSASDIEYKPVSSTSTLQTFGENIYGTIRNITIISSVLIVAFIGIKIMIGSVDQKAEYKKMLAPIVVGLLIVNLAIVIVTAVWDMNEDSNGMDPSTFGATYDAYNTTTATNIRNIAKIIFTYMAYVAGALLIVLVSFFGLKMILGSPEQRAEYKKTFVPLIVGVLIVTLSSTIVNSIWTIASSQNKEKISCEHQFDSAPTCTSGATCKKCGLKIAALGHEFNSAPTCTSGATCKKCGYKILASGHVYFPDNLNDEGIVLSAKCEKCGEDIPKNHKWTIVDYEGDNGEHLLQCIDCKMQVSASKEFDPYEYI